MDGKEVVQELNELYFDQEYLEKELPIFEYSTDGDMDSVYFSGIPIVEWSDDDGEAALELSIEIFNQRIADIFQASADMQCKQMESS